MPRPQAIYFALDLSHTPTLGRIIQREPLPDGVLDVIKIAAGCSETTSAASRRTETPPAILQTAAAVYLQTALFAPDADHYRVLGVARTASREDVRSHMRWLMKWLHPDRQPDDWQSRLAERVLLAWDELKTPERRARYDQTHRPPPAPAEPRSRRLWRRPWLPWVQAPQRARRKKSVWAMRLVVGAAIGVAALTIALVGERHEKRAHVAEGGKHVIGATGAVDAIVATPPAIEP